jgi:hypothetical protein
MMMFQLFHSLDPFPFRGETSCKDAEVHRQLGAELPRIDRCASSCIFRKRRRRFQARESARRSPAISAIAPAS